MTDIEAVDPYAESDAESATDEPSFSPDAEYHKFMWTWVEDMRREFIGTTIARIPHDVLREYLFPMVLHDKHCEWSPGTATRIVKHRIRIAIPALYKVLKYQKSDRAMYPISDYIVVTRRHRIWAFDYAGVELWSHKMKREYDDEYEYLGGGIFIYNGTIYYCNKYGLHNTELTYERTMGCGLILVSSEDGDEHIWNPYNQMQYEDMWTIYFNVEAYDCTADKRYENVMAGAPWWVLHQFPHYKLARCTCR